MNNFELDKKAKELADCYTPYGLARMYLLEKERNEKLKSEATDKRKPSK